MTDREIPSKAQVLEAARQCPQAKETLEILFPGDFEEETVRFKRGTFFRNRKGNLAILASVSSGYFNFIGLDDGNIWFHSFPMEFVEFGDVDYLTMSKERWDEVIMAKKYEWRPVKIEHHLLSEETS